MRKCTRRGPPGRGALGLLAALLMASAGIRFAESGGTDLLAGLRAFAASSEAPSGAVPADRDTTVPAPDAVLAALAEREAALDSRAQALDERERTLAMAEERLDEKLAALKDTERRLRETIALADGAATADLDRLTRMYETMKPKEAAALFETMDPTFAAGFLGQMRPAAAATILAGLAPETAYTISLVLAGRNMRVPTK
jgi:flagellar motility protein MotE (MotC chaperone)